MTTRLSSRVDNAEDALVIGEDRQRLLQLVRRHYNVRMMSTEGIEIDLLCLAGNIERPAWVQAEMDRPIPHDASAQLVREAEAAAQDEMAGLQREPGRERHDKLESVVASCFEHVSVFAGRLIASFDDLRDWLSERGDRPGCESLMEATQYQGGYDGYSTATEQG